jgi:hypothetical protein
MRGGSQESDSWRTEEILLRSCPSSRFPRAFLDRVSSVGLDDYHAVKPPSYLDALRRIVASGLSFNEMARSTREPGNPKNEAVV